MKTKAALVCGLMCEIRGYACDNFDRLLTSKEVCKILGRSHASLYRDIAVGLIPAPVKLGASSRWPASEILAVVEKAKAQRDGEAK